MQFKARREVYALPGSSFMRVPVLDDAIAISKPDEIAAWPKDHPARQHMYAATTDAYQPSVLSADRALPYMRVAELPHANFRS